MDNDEIVARSFENCYYLGRVNGVPDSFVALSTCSDNAIDGFFFHNGDAFTIEPAHKHDINVQDAELVSMQQNTVQLLSVDNAAAGHNILGAHILYRRSDLVESEELHAGKCASASWTVNEETNEIEMSEDEHDHHFGKDSGTLDSLLKHVEETLRVSPPGPAAASANPSGRHLLAERVHHLELGVVNDAAQVALTTSASAATQYALDIVNAVHGMYNRLDTIKVNIALKTIRNILTNDDMWLANGAVPTKDSSMGSFLTGFTKYNLDETAKGFVHDATHALTGLQMSRTASGAAWTGQVCAAYSVGVNEASNGVRLHTVEVMTHEIGHNLGSGHDGDRNLCLINGGIMAPNIPISGGGLNDSILQWSSCSKTYIENKLQSLLGTTRDCLSNAPTVLLTPARCGDFVVSSGEECDYALSPDLCTTECKLKPNIECTAGDCCTPEGKLRAAGFECRSAVHDCDLPDYCDGASPVCPNVNFIADGTACTEAGAGSRCFGGYCVGYDRQCAEAGDLYSSLGSFEHGTCNSQCGFLKCRVVGSSTCQTFLETAGDASTKVKVEDKTPCGTGKYCIAGACVAQPAVAAPCNPSCKNGKCSTLGTCFCDAGFSGTDCSKNNNCNVNCFNLNREDCASQSPDTCGACMAGKEASVSGSNTLCHLTSKSVSASVAAGTVQGADPAHAFDSNTNTAWRGSLDNVQSVSVTASFASAFTAAYYKLTSASDQPGQDPTDFTIQGSNDVANGPWITVDTRTGALWDQRLQEKLFTIAAPGSYAHYRIEVTKNRADGQVSPNNVQIAELKLYATSGALPGASESSLPVTDIIMIAVPVATVLVIAVVAAMIIVDKRRGRYSNNRSAGKQGSKMALHNNSSSAAQSENIHVAIKPTTTTNNSTAAFSPQSSEGVGSAPAQPAPAASSSTSSGLPSGWEMYQDDSGNPYYYNTNTHQTQWEPPM
jgi:Reprolysin (M12B) family zinc metalloprotease/Disintegrin/WW domain